MAFWEILIVCIGLSLDVFAVAVCEGALLGRVKTGRLIVMSLIFCAWQVAALELGRLVSLIPGLDGVYTVTFRMWRTLAAIIFFALAAYLIYKAVKHEAVFEHRSEINYRDIVTVAALTSIDALFVGIGSGFLNAKWLSSGLTLFAVTAVCVILGVFTGYHFGYEQKTKAYWCGGVLFIAAGIDVIIRYLV